MNYIGRLSELKYHIHEYSFTKGIFLAKFSGTKISDYTVYIYFDLHRYRLRKYTHYMIANYACITYVHR